MSPAYFANEVAQYAEYLVQRQAMRLSHEEIDELRRSAYRVFASLETRLGRSKVDGLECVEWVKKYRNEHNVPLKVAKDEWDRRLLAAL